MEGKFDKIGNPTENPKKKFTLELDEVPSFLYVAHGHKSEKIYLHGEKVANWTGLKLESKLDEFTAYDISYIDAMKPE